MGDIVEKLAFAERQYLTGKHTRTLLLDAKTAIEQLRAALHWCGEFSFDGQDIDGGEFQDHMVKLGLMERVPASEKVRAMYDTYTMLAWCWGEQKP